MWSYMRTSCVGGERSKDLASRSWTILRSLDSLMEHDVYPKPGTHFSASCSDGAHFHFQGPGRAAVPRHVAEPAERCVGDVDETPAAQHAGVALADLHDVLADCPADLAQLERAPRIEPGDVPGIDARAVPAQGRAIAEPW